MQVKNTNLAKPGIRLLRHAFGNLLANWDQLRLTHAVKLHKDMQSEKVAVFFVDKF